MNRCLNLHISPLISNTKGIYLSMPSTCGQCFDIYIYIILMASCYWFYIACPWSQAQSIKYGICSAALTTGAAASCSSFSFTYFKLWHTVLHFHFFFLLTGKTCLTQCVLNSECKSFHELGPDASHRRTFQEPTFVLYENVISYYFGISHRHLKLSLQLHFLWVTAGSTKKSCEENPNFWSTVVFSGLRPSRKPRWVPLLPRRPLHLPLSRQGPRSRRRRSWAPTMRSRRIPRTTVKVRMHTNRHTLTHTYCRHLSQPVTSSLYICRTELDSGCPVSHCLFSISVSVFALPPSFLPPSR